MRSPDDIPTSSGQTVLPGPIRDGDLVRRALPGPGHSLTRPGLVTYLYGTVVRTTHPMRDDPDWTDHLVLWHDGEETFWWCGDLELVSRAEEAE